jgi:phosphate starvation-inducible PhoH-like protein
MGLRVMIAGPFFIGTPMGKKNKRTQKKGRPIHHQPDDFQNLGETPRSRKPPAPLVPRTTNQGHYIADIDRCDLVFGLGDAGTGKTYVATRKACEALKSRQVEKIIVTRPMVSAEEDMGYLPGDTEDKFAPYFAPIREILDKALGVSHVDNLIRLKKIEVAPLAFLRGHTFENAFVIFDEAQNTTPNQMKLFLTRIGEGTKAIVCGDLGQVDVLGHSGLADAVDRFAALPEAGVTRFGPEDVTRSGLARKIVEGYRK